MLFIDILPVLALILILSVAPVPNKKLPIDDVVLFDNTISPAAAPIIKLLVAVAKPIIPV